MKEIGSFLENVTSFVPSVVADALQEKYKMPERTKNGWGNNRCQKVKKIITAFIVAVLAVCGNSILCDWIMSTAEEVSQFLTISGAKDEDP